MTDYNIEAVRHLITSRLTLHDTDITLGGVDRVAKEIVTMLTAAPEPVSDPAAPVVGEPDDFGQALLDLLFKHGVKVAMDVSEIERIRQLAIGGSVVGEPVAWLVKELNHDGVKRNTYAIVGDKPYSGPRGVDRIETEPLYAHPDPKLDVAVKAMRDAMDAMTELNTRNYNHDDVEEANNGTIEAWAILEQALAQIKRGA